MNNQNQSATEHPTVLELRRVTGCYLWMLIPTIFFASQAGYIFDGGYTPESETLYWVIVSFPVTILISVSKRR